MQGVQAGHMQFGFVMGIHLLEEFSPELKRTWHFRKILSRIMGKTP
jgi:hypothetical protein